MLECKPDPILQAAVGDFNDYSKDDIAISGGSGWNTMPVAFSNGNGSFTVTNKVINK